MSLDDLKKQRIKNAINEVFSDPEKGEYPENTHIGMSMQTDGVKADLLRVVDSSNNVADIRRQIGQILREIKPTMQRDIEVDHLLHEKKFIKISEHIHDTLLDITREKEPRGEGMGRQKREGAQVISLLDRLK